MKINLRTRLKGITTPMLQRARDYLKPFRRGATFDVDVLSTEAELPPGLAMAMMDVLAIDNHLELYLVIYHGECEHMHPFHKGFPHGIYKCPICKLDVEDCDVLRFNVRGKLRHAILLDADR